MKKGDFLISKVTKVSSCGTIIFQVDHEYEIVDIMDDTNVCMVFTDSEWGEWVINIFEIEEKFIHRPLRSKKINSIISFLSNEE